MIIKPKAQCLCRNLIKRRDETSALGVDFSVGIYDHVVSLERNPGGVVGMRTSHHRNGFIVVAAASFKVEVVVGVVRPSADALR